MREDLLAAQAAFLQAVVNKEETRQFADRWESTTRGIAEAAQSGILSVETLQLFQRISQRLNVVASTLRDTELATTSMVEETVSQAQAVLSEHRFQRYGSEGASFGLASTSQPRRPLAANQPTDVLLAPYRRWFLDHFAFPYLTAADKTALHLAVPSQSEAQCATWFINCRRRSGWGDLYKRFGGEKKEGMERFIREVDSPLTSWQVSEEAKREVEKVRDWFRDEEKNAVGRGIAEVVEQAGEIERKGKIVPRKKGRKPPTNLGVVAPKQEYFEEDLKVDPIPRALALPPAPRNISNSSLNSSASRNFSGISHFPIDSSSTSASSFYSASPMALELPSPRRRLHRRAASFRLPLLFIDSGAGA